MKHHDYDTIVKWASDVTQVVQWRKSPDMEWEDMEGSDFSIMYSYRIKPAPIKKHVYIWMNINGGLAMIDGSKAPNVELIFDPENNCLVDTKFLD